MSTPDLRPPSKTSFLARISHRQRLLAGGVLSVAAYFLVSAEHREATRLLLAWNVGAWTSLVMVAHMIAGPDCKAPADSAPEDASQWEVSALSTVAVCAAIAAIVWELGPIKGMGGARKAEHLALVFTTILSAWTFIHVIFALHYAGSYYAPCKSGGVCRGLQFPGDGEAGWGEFAYQAFVVGCAFATADVNVTTTGMRRIVLTHGVVAFLFNTVILALTINIASGFL
jgi:uncharacterized membrane protein